MPQQERVPSVWVENTASSDKLLQLDSADSQLPFQFTLDALRSNVFRTTFTSKSHPLPPHPSVLPLKKQIEAATVNVSSTSTTKNIKIGPITATIDWTESSPLLSVSLEGSKNGPLHEDLPNRSYVVDGEGIAHYSRYNRDTLYVGLGEGGSHEPGWEKF